MSGLRAQSRAQRRPSGHLLLLVTEVPPIGLLCVVSISGGFVTGVVLGLAYRGLVPPVLPRVRRPSRDLAARFHYRLGVRRRSRHHTPRWARHQRRVRGLPLARMVPAECKAVLRVAGRATGGQVRHCGRTLRAPRTCAFSGAGRPQSGTSPGAEPLGAAQVLRPLPRDAAAFTDRTAKLEALGSSVREAEEQNHPLPVYVIERHGRRRKVRLRRGRCPPHGGPVPRRLTRQPQRSHHRPESGPGR